MEWIEWVWISNCDLTPLDLIIDFSSLFAATDKSVTELIGRYLKEIEKLKARLIESEQMYQQLKKSNAQAARTKHVMPFGDTEGTFVSLENVSVHGIIMGFWLQTSRRSSIWQSGNWKRSANYSCRNRCQEAMRLTAIRERRTNPKAMTTQTNQTRKVDLKAVDAQSERT